MFSYPTDGQSTFYSLTTVDERGLETELHFKDFGLTELQLATFITRSIGTSSETQAPNAEDTLAAVADAYSERNAEELDNLSAIRTDHHMGGTETQREIIAEWSSE